MCDPEDEFGNLYAAVKFYSDKSNKISIVPSTDVENFDINCTNAPHYVKKYNSNKSQFHLSPAEVITAGSEEYLKNNPKRFKFKKKRRSEALEQLQTQSKMKNVTPKASVTKKSNVNNKFKCKNKTKLKKIVQKKNTKKLLQKFLQTKDTLVMNSDSENDNSETDAINIVSGAVDSENISFRQVVSQPMANDTTSTKCQLNVSPNELTNSNNLDSNLEEEQNLFKNCEATDRMPNKKNDDLCTTPKGTINAFNNEYVSPIVIVQSNQHNESTPSKNGSVLSNNATSSDSDDSNAMNSHVNATHSYKKRNLPIYTSSDVSTAENNTPKSRCQKIPEKANNGSETPRNRSIQYKQKCIFRAKYKDIESQEDPYDNRIVPETREVDGKKKKRKLYDIEGDEIYIGCNKMIQLAFWEYIKRRGYSIFLREMLLVYWGRRNLINRCFKVNKVSTALENRSPRKVFSPAKYKQLRRIYKDYLNETYGHSSNKKKILRSMNKLIGYKIRDMRKLNYEVVV